MNLKSVNIMDRKTKIFIAGGTGLIGTYLVRHLYDSGYRPFVISRNKEKAEQLLGSISTNISWDDLGTNQNYFSGKYAIINLSGQNISSSYWTKKFKEKILNSRISAIEKLIQAIIQSSDSPEVFIQGSAIGYYDNKKGTLNTEKSAKGSGFLSDVVEKIEKMVDDHAYLYRRMAIIRTGIFLSKEGGMLKKTIIPYKYYLGGPIGTGNQWRSWIHYYDHVRAVKHILENQHSSGIYNLTSPNPVTESEFSHQLSIILKKPNFLKIPPFLIKLYFGEMAEAIILNGEKVFPEKLISENFSFIFSTIDEALKNLLCE